jgi:thiol:disulfide interchange protein DsbD
MAFLVFAISLAPGMSGGKLGDLDAYVPEPAAGQVGQALSPALSWIKDDYRGALARARAEGKLVFVNFTGYACANCHWMEANILTQPEIAAALNAFVLVDLYTDSTDAATDANQKLELQKFQTAAEPFYAIMDADEKVIATSAGLTRNPQEFLAFLKKAAAQWGGPPGLPSSVSGAGLSDLPKTTLSGVPLSLSGKVVVVNFWATWCVPCVEEIPGFNSVYHEFSPQGLVILGVAMDDEGKSVVEPFLKKHPIDYPVALGSDALADKFGLEGYPITLLFDRAGKLVKRFEGLTGETDLRDAVRHAM